MTSRPHHTVQPPANLRERAQALIQGSPSGPRAAQDASLALRVLFELAASPETASDALALLHELQVHQVELDLQNEELQSSRAELEAAWARQNQLHHAAPCAQLVLNAEGRLLEYNASAKAYFPPGASDPSGQRLDSWLAPASRPRAQEWLGRAQHSQAPMALGLSLHIQGLPERRVCAAARANPLAPGVLVAWVDAPSPEGCDGVA